MLMWSHPQLCLLIGCLPSICHPISGLWSGVHPCYLLPVMPLLALSELEGKGNRIYSTSHPLFSFITVDTLVCLAELA